MEPCKWTYGDKVEFKDLDSDDARGLKMPGTVYIVDAYGTFEQREEPSYDVMFDMTADFMKENGIQQDGDGSQQILYKHIRQSSLKSPDSKMSRLHDGSDADMEIYKREHDYKD